MELKGWALKKSRKKPGDFSVGPVVKTPLFQCRDIGSIPSQGTMIPHAVWHSQKIKTNKNNFKINKLK